MEATTPLLLMLPVELGLMVLERLEPRDVCLSFAPVCRQANSLAVHPLLWSSFYRSTFLLQVRLSAREDAAALMHDGEEDEEDEEEVRREEAVEEAEAVRRRWDRLWLFDAGMTVGEAIDRSYTIDWKAEYIRRLTFKVLVLAHHGAHGSSRYDIDLCRQLKRQDIHHIRICHPDCQASGPEGCKKLGNGGFECVPFTPDVAKDFSAIILFHATAPSQRNRVMMGNVLYDHLQSGGGLVMCCYAYLAENQLAGKWTSHFYPMPSSSFGSPEPQARTSDPRLGVNEEDHPIMNGIRRSRVKIDKGRDTARCKTNPRPGATVVARYADGPPLVVLYDSKANEANSKRPPPMGESTDDDEPSESHKRGGSKRHTPEPLQRIEEKAQQAKDETETEEQGEQWGKTVFVNLFPVSNSDTGLGGWYPPAPQSDIPRLLANALAFVARRKLQP